MRSIILFRKIVLLLLVALAIPHLARADVEHLYEPRVRLSAFRLGAAGIIDSTAGYYVTPRLAWAPAWMVIPEKLFARLELAQMASKSASGSSNNLVVMANLLAGWHEPVYLPFDLEAGAGAQAWLGNAAGRISLIANVVVPLSDEISTFGSRFKAVAGYTYLYDYIIPNHQFALGLQIVLGPLVSDRD